MSPADSVALVTGSTGGLGLAMAEALGRAGHRVVLHGLEPAAAAARAVGELCERGGQGVSYHQADLSDPAEVQEFARRVLDEQGRIDVLVNNAVVRHFAPVESFPLGHWQTALAVNLTAAFLLIQASLPGMRQRRWGRIFNLTSVYGSRGVAGRIDYVTTKTALIGMTRSVAAETIGSGVTCNAVCPGAVLTPTSERRIQASMRETGLTREAAVARFLDGKQPARQFIEASRVADLLVFLAGDGGADITGSVLPIDGGWLAV
jgi:3-hydroxybutyrate dehydrogenase